jgi:hypothetical protein
MRRTMLVILEEPFLQKQAGSCMHSRAAEAHFAVGPCVVEEHIHCARKVAVTEETGLSGTPLIPAPRPGLAQPVMLNPLCAVTECKSMTHR